MTEHAAPVLPPRPAGGYPDEFFTSWATSPAGFRAWFEAYMAGAQDHSDFFSWAMRHGAPADPAQHRVVEDTEEATAMRVTGVRLPELLIAGAEQRGAGTKEGRSGVIRAALEEYFERHPLAPA